VPRVTHQAFEEKNAKGAVSNTQSTQRKKNIINTTGICTQALTCIALQFNANLPISVRVRSETPCVAVYDVTNWDAMLWNSGKEKQQFK
jgi:hypothetical protein